MNVHTTVFLADCRARGYTAEDERLLRRELEPLGAVRLRRLHLPEAGGSYEIWLGVEFVGLAMLSGLVGHVTGKYYDSLATRLRRFFQAKTANGTGTPEMSLKISYDDAVIEIPFADDAALENLQELADQIHSHLQHAPLAGRSVYRVLVGMYFENNAWHEPSMWDSAAGNTHHWGISFEGHGHVSHIYDPATRLLAPLPEGSD